MAYIAGSRACGFPAERLRTQGGRTVPEPCRHCSADSRAHTDPDAGCDTRAHTSTHAGTDTSAHADPDACTDSNSDPRANTGADPRACRDLNTAAHCPTDHDPVRQAIDPAHRRTGHAEQRNSRHSGR